MNNVFQINPRKSGSALNLLRQTAAKFFADIVLISNQLKVPLNNTRWFSSENGLNAVTLTNVSSLTAV